jgi:transglutaminase-like putative cysteine protease
MIPADQSFNADARLSAVCANDLDDLRAQFGTVGLSAGPRTGPNRRSTHSTEAYLARRLLEWLARRARLEFPVSVEHCDSPDFLITEGNLEYGLEVTEACAPEDGREMAAFEFESAPMLLGGIGGRGAGGHFGDEPERQVVADIRKQISRKSQKPYARMDRIDLLIYPNSNPVFVFSERSYRMVESQILDFSPFRRTFLYWGESRISELTSP